MKKKAEGRRERRNNMWEAQKNIKHGKNKNEKKADKNAEEEKEKATTETKTTEQKRIFLSVSRLFSAFCRVSFTFFSVLFFSFLRLRFSSLSFRSFLRFIHAPSLSSLRPPVASLLLLLLPFPAPPSSYLRYCSRLFVLILFCFLSSRVLPFILHVFTHLFRCSI